ncbi:MAG: hypothetical protein H0T89_16650 [Deltaproteobacteria bacterium]|nr:hypothetical protein [Deltaproteobacteria bacterium]MDQ3297753.1 hypothetical protein [Myxococcota bacterium]
MAGVIVEVGARRFAVPYECPCCGAAPDSELIIALTPTKDRPVAPETARELGFPYCMRCVEHATRWESSSNVETGIKVLGLLLGLIFGMMVHLAVGIALFAVAVALSILLGRSRRAQAKAACGPACAATGLAVEYRGWSGNASTLEFASHVYAARFAEQNAAKLVNISPQLRKVTEGHKLARLAIPTPAAAVRTVPSPATVADWIARLETATGRVARLDSLHKALDACPDEADRKALIDTATRIELAALARKLDVAPGPTKTRQIQKAIIETRADNIPDELRDELVRQLEAQLR